MRKEVFYVKSGKDDIIAGVVGFKTVSTKGEGMKKKSLVGIAAVVLAAILSVPCLADTSNWDMGFESQIGGAAYKEKYTTLDSKWNAFFY